VVYAYQFRFEVLLRGKHSGLRLGLPLKVLKSFAVLVRVTSISTSKFLLLFSFYALKVGLNYNSDFKISKNSVKITVG
jgi:hypothetical protein